MATTYDVRPPVRGGGDRGSESFGVTRGQVWWVALDPAVGDEIRKTRPGVIISTDNYNGSPHNQMVMVLPLKRWRSGSAVRTDEVLIEPPEGGLVMPGVTAASHIRAVDRERLLELLGELRPATMRAIARVLQKRLGLV